MSDPRIHDTSDTMSDRTSPNRRGLLLSTVGCVVAPLAGCVGTPPRTDGGTATRDVRVIAHRGCADQYPENTVLAAERSAPYVDMIEVDVQRCGSGELVVFHDDELDRLTDATGSVATTDWERLRELTVLDSEQHIPLLSDLLDAVPADTAVNVELKHEGMAADVMDAASAVENEILFSSFSATALREIRERDDAASLALVVADSPEISRSIAADLGCVAVHPDYELVLGTEFVARAHEDGFAVNAWTVDDEETAAALVEAGVDGLFVDRWDVV